MAFSSSTPRWNSSPIPRLMDDQRFIIGSNPTTDAILEPDTGQTNDAVVLWIGSGMSRTLIVADLANRGNDYAFAAQTNPTVVVFSATASSVATNQYVAINHNQTHGVITVGIGRLNLTAPSGVYVTANGFVVTAGGVTITTGGLTVSAGAVTISTINGIDYNPGSDTDVNIATIGVTGTPIWYWDESDDGFHSTHALRVDTNLAVGSTSSHSTAGRLAHFATTRTDPASNYLGNYTNITYALTGNNARALFALTVDANTSGAFQFTGRISTARIYLNVAQSTLDEGRGIEIQLERTSGTFTRGSGLYLLTPSGVITTSHGIYAEDGWTYPITIGSSDANQNLIHVGVTGDPVFSWVEADDRFALSKGLAIVGVLKSTSATEIGIQVTNSALTVGTAGSVVLPYLAAAQAAGTDGDFGNLNGSVGVLMDTTPGANTIEVRVNGVWLSVGVAGYVFQSRVPFSAGMEKSWWHHPNQLHENGNRTWIDESICVVCGQPMNPEDKQPAAFYPNATLPGKGVHAVFGHLHLENVPAFSSIEERVHALEEANQILREQVKELKGVPRG